MANKEMSRKWLEELGIEADAIDAISDAHGRLMAKIKNEKDDLQNKLDDLQTKYDAVDTSKDWKTMYNDLVDANAKKDARSAKENALRAACKTAGVTEKRIDAVLRIADYDKIDMGEDGKAKDPKALVDYVKADFDDYIPKVTKESAGAANPPANEAGTTNKMSKADILKIADASERQAAWGKYIISQQKGN